MTSCPKCHTELASESQDCRVCEAIDALGAQSLSDLAPPPHGKARRSAAGILMKLGLASVVIPFVGMCLGAFLANVIPGCSCDEGAGCHGCGLNRLVEVLAFGGGVAALGALITVLPCCVVLAFVVDRFSRE